MGGLYNGEEAGGEQSGGYGRNFHIQFDRVRRFEKGLGVLINETERATCRLQFF